jgi:hypothetical protein
MEDVQSDSGHRLVADPEADHWRHKDSPPPCHRARQPADAQPGQGELPGQA